MSFRSPASIKTGLIDRDTSLAFSFNGRQMTGHAGDTLASALIANGVKLVGRSFKYHRPRGIFTAGSEEPNALVTLREGAHSEPNTRATVAELFDGLVARSQNHRGPLNFDLLAVKAGNIYLTIRGRAVPQGLALSIIDVTRAKKAEQHMLDAILEATEAQRRKLSKEIHDGIGPLISTIKLNLDALQLEIKGENARALQMIESMSELLKTMSNDIRSISHNLMPNVLVDFGLVAALDNLCQRVNSSGKVQANFYHSDIRERIGRKMALGLYRISQELINNAVKYAGASTINVQLIRHSNSIVLMVEDDGVGFSPHQPHQSPAMDKGIGLKNIQTRVRSLGGSFILESQPGQGVLATIEVPMSGQGGVDG